MITYKSKDFKKHTDSGSSLDKAKLIESTGTVKKKEKNANQIVGKFTGFGIGALEDIEEEDEDIYLSGGGILVEPEEEDEKPSHRLERRKERIIQSHDGVLPGFNLASVSTCHMECPSSV
jgi:hypothetical protein